MPNVTVFGGTGFAGSHIAREAAARGWPVTAVARRLPDEKLPGVDYAIADLSVISDFENIAANADAIIIAMRASAPLGHGTLVDVIPAALAIAAENQARLIVVGGAGSSLTSPGGPRLVDTADFPEASRPEALAHAAILELLLEDQSDADWTYVSPAAAFGADRNVEHRGTYRTGTDELVKAKDGSSSISGEDFARAIADEVAHPSHHHQRFTVGY